MLTDTTYDQLLSDLGTTFRPQRQWVEGRGLYLIIGHFLSGVGAGTWLFSLWFGHQLGLRLAIVAVGLGGIAHLLFLGRPSRFWKMFRLRTSWIARGFVGMKLVGMALLIIYKGNVYAASKGVPFWNSPVLPILYATYAIRGGVALLLVALPFTGNSLNAEYIGLIELWVAVSAGVMLGFYVAVMRQTNLAARHSVDELTRGRVAGTFYLGTIGIGLVVPILLGIAGFGYPLSQVVLALVRLSSLVGDFFAKYTIAKAGIYHPLMPVGRA
jgi:formate-dependent nitrite reductase membrane component NrfD